MLPGRLAAPTSGERLGSPKCYGSARVLGDRGVPIRSYSLGPQRFSESSCQPHLLHFLRSSELQAASFKLQASSFNAVKAAANRQPAPPRFQNTNPALNRGHGPPASSCQFRVVACGLPLLLLPRLPARALHPFQIPVHGRLGEHVGRHWRGDKQEQGDQHLMELQAALLPGKKQQ